MKKVKKRDGTMVDFDASKIRLAIQKANNDVALEEQANEIVIKRIIDCVANRATKENLDVEEIQDFVEEGLMKSHLYKLGKAYIVFRYKRYWEHEGVDWLSTAKAGYLYLKDSSHITRGGSTITQQLVKNQYLTFEKSLGRKAKEIFIALQMHEGLNFTSLLDASYSVSEMQIILKLLKKGCNCLPLVGKGLDLEHMEFLIPIADNGYDIDFFCNGKESISSLDKRGELQ